MELLPENPPEVNLLELWDFINTLMQSVGAELRHVARQLPVKIKYNYYDNDFVITNATIDKNGMVLTIDPVF